MSTITAGGLPIPADTDALAELPATVAALAKALGTAVVTTANEQHTASAPANHPDLKFTVVGGKRYVFRLALALNSNSSASEVPCRFTHPGGTITFGGIAQDVAAPAGASVSSVSLLGVQSTASPSPTLTIGQNAVAAGGFIQAVLEGSYIATAGGTVQFQFGSSANTAVFVNVLAGSTLTVREARA